MLNDNFFFRLLLMCTFHIFKKKFFEFSAAISAWWCTLEHSNNPFRSKH